MLKNAALPDRNYLFLYRQLPIKLPCFAQSKCFNAFEIGSLVFRQRRSCKIEEEFDPVAQALCLLAIETRFIPARTNRIDRIFHCSLIKRPDIFALNIFSNTKLLLERAHTLLTIKESLYERGIARKILLRQ